MLDIFLSLLLSWFLINVLIIIFFLKDLISLWQEPMLRYPVLIFESDDWGAGPQVQQVALAKLGRILSQFKDDRQNHPVMTLAVILAIPDAKKIKRSSAQEYHRLLLSDPQFEGLVKTINEGVKRNIFALQLHGLEHYWPQSLIKVSADNLAVRRWLESEDFPLTEKLPIELQSRWTDASQLPSLPLDKKNSEYAANLEIEEYKKTFGFLPAVIVPPTFVWNMDVENIWFNNGLKFIVTPGRQYDQRLPGGKLHAVGGRILNGQISESGLLNIVRDDYFEPVLGHNVEKGLSSLKRKTEVGRPTLLETHRFNFIGEKADDSFVMVEQLLNEAIKHYPSIKFISTEKLARIFVNEDDEFLETEFRKRLIFWLTRIKGLSKFWRLARMSGLFIILRIVKTVVQDSMKAI